MSDECEHEWVERTPDPGAEPLLRIEGLPIEDHEHEVCSLCGGYRTTITPAGDPTHRLVLTYR